MEINACIIWTCTLELIVFFDVYQSGCKPIDQPKKQGGRLTNWYRLLLLYRRVIILIKGKEDLLYPFNMWFTFFVELIYRLLPSIINYQKFGRTASFHETAGKQNTRETVLQLMEQVSDWCNIYSSTQFSYYTSEDPLWSLEDWLQCRKHPKCTIQTSLNGLVSVDSSTMSKLVGMKWAESVELVKDLDLCYLLVFNVAKSTFVLL